MAAVSRQLGGASVRAVAGAILGGSMRHDGRSHDIGAGWLVSIAGAYQWTFAGRWFATATLSAGRSWTETREQGGAAVSLTAGDMRVGGLVGMTLHERVSPYVLARGFAGPVGWQLDGEDVTGTDQHHYQLGLGASVRLPLRATAVIDASLVGERSVSLGVGLPL